MSKVLIQAKCDATAGYDQGLGQVGGTRSSGGANDKGGQWQRGSTATTRARLGFLSCLKREDATCVGDALKMASGVDVWWMVAITNFLLCTKVCFKRNRFLMKMI